MSQFFDNIFVVVVVVVVVCVVWLTGCLFFNSKYISVGILVKTTCIHPLQYTFYSHPDLDFLAFIIKLCIYGLYAWATSSKNEGKLI